MKFYEKLIMLRKKALLSQEGLAEKLNVTRQTISKWELGQSKPDLDKLSMMSKLFGVDINTLTDDELSLEDNKTEEPAMNTKPKKKGNRKFLLYIIIIIFLTSFLTLGYRLAVDIKVKVDSYVKEVQEKQAKIKQQKEEEKKKIEEEKNRIKEEQAAEKLKMEKDRFNNTYSFYSGTNASPAVSTLLDRIIDNNKTNQEHVVEVIFDGELYGTDGENIRRSKDRLRSFTNYQIQFYEVAMDYDANGFIDKVTIVTK